MQAAILAAGDELTCGYRLDTNSQAIAQQLSAIPLDVVLHLTVGDDSAHLQHGLQTALEAAEVVIITGGLGPTEDDLTRQAVAAFFNRPLVENPEALSRIRERFTRRGKTMPDRNRIQAQVPADSQVIQNKRGTAAGFYLQEGAHHLFAIPGVPYEMTGMMEDFVLPHLRELADGNAFSQRGVLKLFGPSESKIAEQIHQLLPRNRNPLLGLLPHQGTITIEIVARGATAEDAHALLVADLVVLRETFGTAVLCEDERELPQVMGDLIAANGLTMAIAETAEGTGGTLNARVTEAAGSKEWFRSGKVTNQAPAGSIAAWATEVRQAAGADVGLVTGDIESPQDAAPDRPYGVLEVAVDFSGTVTHRRLSYNGDRGRVRQFAADAALNLVRLEMLKAKGRV